MGITDIEPNAEDYDQKPLREAAERRYEPDFTLRAQDLLAPAAIRMWCEMAAIAGVSAEKIKEARQIALAMEFWSGKRKLPD